ncbi:hypothetical protein [Streptomyces muensis]|uniref:Secreted protein n=1 Tax=Streptomyces muensis TaxID=1077944 RepID=A0A9X1TNB3_STRM4|nr:hypothetical protein [Streptomyces muensis]MCF1598331.1 hypothetical protein [Streptomyces muensis]
MIAAVVTGALAAGAAPASANASDGYVSGAYEFQDDFGDEGTLTTSSYAHTNATALWQWVLWAEGAEKSNGDPFLRADIDGKVGTETFGAVDKNIEYVSTDYDSGAYRTKLRYKGDANSFFLYRSSTGVYRIHIPNVGWKPASYTYASC